MEETKRKSLILKVIYRLLNYIIYPCLLVGVLGYFSFGALDVLMLDREGGSHAIMFGLILAMFLHWVIQIAEKIIEFVLFQIKERVSL
jgi:hypothetical protein